MHHAVPCTRPGAERGRGHWAPRVGVWRKRKKDFMFTAGDIWAVWVTDSPMLMMCTSCRAPIALQPPQTKIRLPETGKAAWNLVIDTKPKRLFCRQDSKLISSGWPEARTHPRGSGGIFPHLADVYSMKPSQIRRKLSISLWSAQHCLLQHRFILPRSRTWRSLR